MTDRPQPDSASTTSSTRIIRYALELGLLWVGGDGRDKVREALDALDTLEAQLEAVGAGGVQALSAAPAVDITTAGEMQAFEAWYKQDCVIEGAAAKMAAKAAWKARAMLAASPTPPAEQQAAPKAAPEVGNSGFDYKTAADFLNGKTVSDEAVRKFVAASRWAHDERAALSATLLAMHGVLTSREAEIALLKKALLEAEAPPQQEAKEPVMIYHGRCTIDCGEHGHHDMEMLRMIPSGSKLYTAPQPAPVPLSECLRLLNSFEYEGDEDSQAKAFFKAHINEDWFFHVKNSLELALAAQGGKDA